MKKVGRKKGQSGARVRYNGRRARYGPISGSIEQYKAQWDYLDSLAHISGAGSKALLRGLQLLMNLEDLDQQMEILSLTHKTHEMVSQVLDLVRHGIVLNSEIGEHDLNEQGHDKLQSLVSKVSE
jgi:hypothetical protein